MADVRSMLRAERASRAPPNAVRKQAPSPPPSKKRKAPDESVEARKRNRADEPESIPPPSSKDSYTADKGPEVEIASTAARNDPLQVQEPSIQPKEILEPTEATVDGVDEDEWAAFEREIAQPVPPSPPPQRTAVSTLQSSATISAAPMTTAELETQKRKEQQKAERARKEEEVEGEREDAARTLEAEFEEMEALEDRVRRLREKRETLRRGSVTAEPTIAEETSEVPPSFQEAGEDEGEGDEDEDDLDEWAFGRR